MEDESMVYAPGDLHPDIRCGECGSKMRLRESKFGVFWGCTKYPVCRGTASAHKETGKPMGRPADQETRRWRSCVHAAFDPLWRNGGWTRKQAYLWLAKEMGKTLHDCHFALFTREECQKAVDLINAKGKTLIEGWEEYDATNAIEGDADKPVRRDSVPDDPGDEEFPF